MTETRDTEVDARHRTRTETNWRVDYDVEPIYVRDPVAEALAVLDSGDPFAVTYRDVVKAAGHSCPTAAGAFRLSQVGLDALYGDDLPVRGDVEVTAGGSASDPTYGVTARLVSYVTGAAGEDGFAGLSGGYGRRKNRLHFGDFGGANPTFAFERIDTGDAVRVTYRVDEVPGPGAAASSLPALIDGTAGEDEREAFRSAWHARVQAVLTDDDLFAVARGD